MCAAGPGECPSASAVVQCACGDAGWLQHLCSTNTSVLVDRKAFLALPRDFLSTEPVAVAFRFRLWNASWKCRHPLWKLSTPPLCEILPVPVQSATMVTLDVRAGLCGMNVRSLKVASRCADCRCLRSKVN